MTWQHGVFVAERTVALPVYRFDQQRELCATCRHVEIEDRKGKGGTAWMCTQGGRVLESCSLMRMAGRACGLDGMLYEAKEAG